MMSMAQAAPDDRRDVPDPGGQAAGGSAPAVAQAEPPLTEPAQAPAEEAATPRRVRVAWFLSQATLDHFARSLQSLAVGLLDELVEVTVVCRHGVDVAQLPSPPVELLRHGPLNWLLFETAAMPALLADLRSGKIDLVHSLDAPSAATADKVARRLDLPLAVNSLRLGDGRWLAPLARGATVLAASEPIRQDLLSRRAVRPERLHLVRPGVYHVRHATCFDNPGCSTSIVAGGALEDFRAFQAVLQSFADLQACGHDCALFVLGEGRAERLLRAQADRLGLRAILTFIGPQRLEQMLEIYKAADVYVAPVPSESVDMQALMAMAAGVPVLAAAGGADDFTIDGRTAQVFPVGDSLCLTTELVALLEDRASARAMAERALEYVRKLHSPAGAATAVAGIYRRAL